jgi:hypothetical protein
MKNSTTRSLRQVLASSGITAPPTSMFSDSRWPDGVRGEAVGIKVINLFISEATKSRIIFKMIGLGYRYHYINENRGGMYAGTRFCFSKYPVNSLNYSK